MSIETVKKYWNDRPCNVKHSKKSFMSKEYFDEVESKKYFVEPHIPKFADFKKWNGKKVLELGCGIGTDSINFVRNGADLTIVELSEKSLEICKQRFKVYGLKANFYSGNIESLSDIVPLQYFDLIYSFGVIHHTPNPEKVFSEISKYMGVETELRIMLYSKISYKLFWVMMENGIKQMSDMETLIRSNAEAQYGCPVAYTYTFEDIQKMLGEYNINVNKIWKDHIFTWDIPNYKNNLYVKDKYWAGVDEKTFKEFEKELGWHTLVIAKKDIKYKTYKYPFNTNIMVTEKTLKLTPYTFYPSGSLWEFNQIRHFYDMVIKSDKKQPVVIDIGAQTGLYTLFSKYVKNAKFYSFEPYKPCFNELCENIKINGVYNVTPFNIALSNKKEKKTLRVPSQNQGLSTLGSNPTRFSEHKTFEVQCDTIDNLFYEKNIRVDFIKCDTEGWEYNVLLGGLKTIQKYKPVLQLEYSPVNMSQCNISIEMFEKLMGNIGYRCTYQEGEERIYEFKHTLKSFLVEAKINFEDEKIKLAPELNNVYIDIGLSWCAPQSALWCKEVDNIIVFGFEPAPEAIRNVIEIQKNFKQLPGSRVGKSMGAVVQRENQQFHLIKCGLGDKNGFMPFYQTTNDVGTSSFYEPKNLGNFSVIKANIFRLEDFFDLFPWDTHPYISYIKIDAQGSDLNILKGAGRYLSDRVVFVTAEPDGYQYKGADDNNRSNIVNFMTSVGFEHINHPNTVDPTFINSKFKHLQNKIYIKQIL